MEFLSATPEIKKKEVPVYVFCDGGEKSAQTEISFIIKKYPFVANTVFHHAQIGLPKNIHFAQKKMFEEYKVERTMFLEDDILVSPFYYRFMNWAMDYFNKTDPTVAMVNSSIICNIPFDQKVSYRLFFGDIYSSLSNYILGQKAWEIIKDFREEYIRLFIDTVPTYKLRNHTAINEWVQKKIKDAALPKEDRFRKIIFSSQDGITNMALRLAGLKYMSSYVNRAIHIGKEGEHCNLKYYIEAGYTNTHLDILPQDEMLTTQFRLMEK